MAAYDVPPPPGLSKQDPRMRDWLYEIFKRNQTLLDSASVLNDLSDVGITTPLSGQVIQYDGANWINVELDGDNLTDNFLLMGA